MVAELYTSASIQASSIPEFSMDTPIALKAAMATCSSPSLGTTLLFKSGRESKSCTTFQTVLGFQKELFSPFLPDDVCRTRPPGTSQASVMHTKLDRWRHRRILFFVLKMNIVWRNTLNTHTLKSFAIITRWGDIDKIRSNMVIGGHREFQNY